MEACLVSIESLKESKKLIRSENLLQLFTIPKDHMKESFKEAEFIEKSTTNAELIYNIFVQMS